MIFSHYPSQKLAQKGGLSGLKLATIAWKTIRGIVP